MDVTSQTAKDWTIHCLKEYCSFSKGKYFLIGADEWQAPDHLLATDGFNVGKVWADQVNLAVAYLVSQKRMPIVWHDMLVHYPEAMRLLSRDAVIAFWFYDEDADYAVLDTFKKLGFQVIMASGMCGGLLTTRRMRAVESSLASMARHKVDMFMMTSWENARWEMETADIPLVGMLLRNEKPPLPIIEAISRYELLERNPDSSLAPGYAAEIQELLTDGSWQKYPEAHAFIENMITHNHAASLASFAKYHFSEGPLYNRIKAASRAVPAAAPAPTPRKTVPARTGKDSFDLLVRKDPRRGEWISFTNGVESFDVYPRFGGSLQNWRAGDEIIIPGGIDERLEKGKLFEKGGYRSYTSIGGLRPIWGLGTHHNPCILWQYPYEWKIIDDTADVKTLELSRSFYHVDITYRISIQKGMSGFSYSLTAVNKLDSTYGAFNFNLPLSFCDAEIRDTSLEWEEGQQSHRLPFADVKDSFFVIPAKRSVKVRKRNYLLTIDCGDAGAAGFYVDWSTTFITPDLHGEYKPLRKGDVTEAAWTFHLGQ